MSDQIVLSWDVSVVNTPLSAAAMATRLGAVSLYTSVGFDPVLGQLLGLTVQSDATSEPDASTARRTLTLNMTRTGTAKAPPVFPCHPRTAVPPVTPYPLTRNIAIPGTLFPSLGSTSVSTAMSLIPTLSIGDRIQFLSQLGVFYGVTAVSSSSITITPAFTGKTGSTPAFKEIAAPITAPAIYSSSDQDTSGFATVPAIPAGSGARTVTVVYEDSTGSSFSTTVSLTGRRPAAVPLAMGSIDIAEITSMVIATVGAFGNNVGQITLGTLSDTLPVVPPDATPEDFTVLLTEAAQMLVDSAVVYMPPSYFALAQQRAAAIPLSGDFAVTTNSANVPTTIDQTGLITAGNLIVFAAQLRAVYEVASVGPKAIVLTEPYTGIDTNNMPEGPNVNLGTKGNLGSAVMAKRTGASLSPGSAAQPSDTRLAAALGQFLVYETAGPPPLPPAQPTTITLPTVLSGFFTRTLQLALAGVTITPRAITFV